MRSIWRGSITFGLVNVPVKLYSATESHDAPLHQVHDKDGGRIRYQRRCEICGRIVDYEHIDKAYDDGERTVHLTDADLRDLPAERSHEIEVVEFVPSDQIDPVRFDRSYFLEPDGRSGKAYALLRRTLEATDRTAVVQFALRQKTRLGALRVQGRALIVHTLLWDDEVRTADFASLEEQPRITKKELDMSASLVGSLEADFDASKFTDEYQEELRRLIDAKLESGDDVDTAATFGEDDEDDGDDGEVVDLMDALRRSIESRGSSSGGGATKSGGAAKASGTKSGGTAKSSGTKSSGTKSSGTKSRKRAG